MLSVSSEDASNRNSYLLILEIYQVQAFPETVYWFLTKLNRIWPYNPGFTPLGICTTVWKIQFSCSVLSNSLWTHELQHIRFPVHHQLPELAQTHVHWVHDAIQPSHPLSSPPPAFNLSHQQGLSRVSGLHHVAKVLEFQLQYQSFQWRPRTDIL